MNTEDEFSAYREKMAVEANGRPILHCIEHFEHPDNQWRAIYNTKTDKWYTDRGEWSGDIYKALRFILMIYTHTAKENAEKWLAMMQGPDSEIDDKEHLVIKTLSLSIDKPYEK